MHISQKITLKQYNITSNRVEHVQATVTKYKKRIGQQDLVTIQIKAKTKTLAINVLKSKLV